MKKQVLIYKKQGYTPAGHFILPAKTWWESYYNPTIEVLKHLKEKYKGKPRFRAGLAGD